MDIISLNGLRACPINPSMRIMQNNRMMQIVLCLHDDTIRFLEFIETDSNYMFQACQTRRKHDAFNKMYSVWYDACSDPAHELCKRRISREFNELVHSYCS